MTGPEEGAARAHPRQQFDDFELIRKIGDGGSAEVFVARNRVFEVEVALKRWYRTPTPDEQRKFNDECRLHWRLSDHPNIVRLYWAEAATGQRPWLATELYDRSLADALRDGPVAPAQAWAVAEAILGGLAAIHASRHLHRDVKPENVLLRGDQAVLCDLGIVMRAGGVTSFTNAGTHEYLAPELNRGLPPSYRSDVYSAGVTIGRLFPDNRPAELDTLLARATDADPQRRPADADDFLARLRAIAPAGKPGAHRTRRGRRPLVVGAVAAVTLLTATGVALARGAPLTHPGALSTSSATPAVAPSSSATLAVPSAVASPSAGAIPPSPTTAASSSGAPVVPVPGGSPAAGPCAAHPSVGTAITYSVKLAASSPDATMTKNGGTIRVSFPGQYTWAGLFLGLPRGTCRYRLDLEARIIDPGSAVGDEQGWGLGLGPCNVVTDGQPFGYSLQQAFFQRNGTASGNSGVFHNPDVNDGKLVDIPADYVWHRWTLEVRDGSVSISREFGVAVTSGKVSGADGLPSNCDRAGVYLRVFNGSAEFRSISLTGV